MRSIIERAIRANNQRNEAIIRSLLSRWVSELEPAVAWQGNQIIGLTLADLPVGSKAFVVVGLNSSFEQ